MESSGPSNLMSNCSHLSSNFGMSGGQSDQEPSQAAFTSFLSPHTRYNDVNAHQSFGNGTHDEMDMGTERPFHSGIGYGTESNQALTDQQHLSHLQQPGPQTFQHPEQFQSLEESMLFQQQQQQLLQMQRQALLNAAAAQTNALQRRRLLQIQQQQQQGALPQQRYQMQQRQLLPRRSPVIKLNVVTLCTNRIAQYIFCQNTRPRDNNIGYWRLFVAEFFTPDAKKKWCVSLYGKFQLANGVAIPEDAWHCEICNHKPGQGFEAKFELLPRLFEIKYETGVIEELLYVDLPRGTYFKPSGRIALTYDKAVQHTIYEQLRVVREGRLRILFTADLKIHSWEFCAIRHEELVPRRQLTPQVRQLANTAEKYLACTQKTSSKLSAAELQSTCSMFATSAREVAQGLEGPLLDEFGYSKRYVSSLKITGVLEHMSMKAETSTTTTYDDDDDVKTSTTTTCAQQ